MEHSKRVRRRHDDELKAKVLSECALPGASVAQIALTHGLNANLIHKWRRQAGERSMTPPEVTTFIPVTMTPAAHAAVNDILVEFRRGALTMKVTWPVSAAADLAAWTRELLR